MEVDLLIWQGPPIRDSQGDLAARLTMCLHVLFSQHRWLAVPCCFCSCKARGKATPAHHFYTPVMLLRLHGLQTWAGQPEKKQAAQDILVKLAKANSEV